MNSPSFRRPNWIFFDLDDTLWDFKGNSLKSLRSCYSRFEEINRKFPTFEDFSAVYHQHNSKLWELYAKGEVSSEFLKTERWRKTLFPDSDKPEDMEVCSRINEFYLFTLSSFPETVAGAHKLLQILSQKYMISVISNGFSDTQYRKLRNSGLWRYITRMIVSDETDFQKPDPRLFHYAGKETGAIGWKLMVGDNISTDIIGALRAGWYAILYNPEDKASKLSASILSAEGINPSLYLGEVKTLDDVGELISKCDAVNR